MLNKILSLFLKPNCPLCDRPADDIVCNYCQRQLESCKISNRSQYWQGELPLFVWGEYEGKLKRAIASLKYDQHPDLGELMGLWLGKTWRDSQIYSQKHSQGTSEMGTSEMKRLEMKRLTVVPIPLHKKKAGRKRI